MDGCEIYRTAEIVLGKIAGMKFKRTYDSETGYFELQPVVKPPGGGNGWLSLLIIVKGSIEKSRIAL